MTIWSSHPVCDFRGKWPLCEYGLLKEMLYIPWSIRWGAGADADRAKLPTRKAIRHWFGQKAKGTIVGLILCQWVQIGPLSSPVASVGFTYIEIFYTIQCFYLSMNNHMTSKVHIVFSPVSLYPQSSILILSALTIDVFHVISRVPPTFGVP